MDVIVAFSKILSIRFAKSPSFFGLSSALNEVNLTLKVAFVDHGFVGIFPGIEIIVKPKKLVPPQIHG